jgi:hypothetical protein
MSEDVVADLDKIDEHAKSLLEDSFKPLTKEMIYQAAAAGLDSESARILARQMGLLDEDTYDALKAIDDLKKGYDGNIESLIPLIDYTGQLGARIDGLHDKTITITTKYVKIGAEPGPETNVIITPEKEIVPKPGGAYADGGSFTIPQSYGYEGYPLGPGKTASGGERVTVTPSSAPMPDPIDYDRMARIFRDTILAVG